MEIFPKRYPLTALNNCPHGQKDDHAQKTLSILALLASLVTGCDVWLAGFDTFHGLTMVSTNPDFVCDSTSPTFSLLNASGEILYRGAYVVPGTLGLQFRDVDRYHTGSWVGGWHNAGEIASVMADCTKREGTGYLYAHAEAAVDWMGGRSASVNLVLKKTAMPMMPMPNDRDHDGIPDAKDNCPDTMGIPENYGCPAEAPAPMPPTGDCMAVAPGTRDANFSSFICWPKADATVMFTASQPLKSLSTLSREWIDESKQSLPLIVRLNTSDALSTSAKQFDKTGTALAPLNDMFSTMWYVLDPRVAVIKSNITTPASVGFKYVMSDMTGTLLESDCPVSSLVMGADTCQP